MMRHFGLKAAALAAGVMLFAASQAAAQCTHTPQVVVSNAGPGPWGGTYTFNLTEANTINSLLATGCFFSGHTNQREVVFEFNAPSTGTYIIDTNLSTLGGADTKIWIFTNCASPTTTQVGCNDDISGTNFLSEATVTLTAGTTYFVSVEGWNATANGEVANLNFTFAPPPPANDACASAVSLDPLPQNDVVNLGLCADEGFDGSLNLAGARDVFYTYTPTATGDYRYFSGGATGNVDTVHTVCTGACGALTEVTCIDNFVGGAEIAFHTLTSGTAYTFVSEGYGTTTGNIISGLSGPVAAASAGGDDCNAPIVVGTVPFSETNVDMSRNANWLNWSGVSYGGDRIYAFTAPADGSFRFTCTPVTPTFDPMLIGLTTDCVSLAQFPGNPAADNTGAGQAEYVDVVMTTGATVHMYLQDFNGFGGVMNFSIQDATAVTNWSEM